MTPEASKVCPDAPLRLPRLLEYSFLIGAPPFRVNISNIEYEVDDGDDKEINDEKNKKIRDHLMGFQMIIEEDVKDHVNEGTYLKIMDKLKDIYTELN